MASTFSITAQSGTDTWRKPPSTDRFNSPTSTGSDPVTAKALTKFLSASVSFNIKPKELYEQAGILLSFLPTNPSSSSFKGDSPPKWIKAGIEQYLGVPRIGIVATDNYSDWSVNPVVQPEADWTTIRIEREKDDMGYSLWVYQVLGDGEKVPLREINWVYGIGEDWEIKVEAYAAKPGDEGEPVTVEFKDLKVGWSD